MQKYLAGCMGLVQITSSVCRRSNPSRSSAGVSACKRALRAASAAAGVPAVGACCECCGALNSTAAPAPEAAAAMTLACSARSSSRDLCRSPEEAACGTSTTGSGDDQHGSQAHSNRDGQSERFAELHDFVHAAVLRRRVVAKQSNLLHSEERSESRKTSGIWKGTPDLDDPGELLGHEHVGQKHVLLNHA